MQLIENLEKIVQSGFKRLSLAWWVEINTKKPLCAYYFGPFDSQKEAKASQDGYVEDLVQEGTQGISVQIRRCNPKQLTTCDLVG